MNNRFRKKHKNPLGNISDWVLAKNNQLIVFNKPAGLPVQNASQQEKSLQSVASSYAKRDLYLIHRIDQPVSGIVVFGRHKKHANKLSQQFRSSGAERTYLAVVEKLPNTETNQLKHYLKKDRKLNKSFIVEELDDDTKEATLTWEHIGDTDNYPVLKITLHSGRFHQIRCQLAHVGASIKGDVKYGAKRSNKDRSIYLHAWKCEIKHPISEELIKVEAPLPKDDTIWSVVNSIIA